MPEDEEYEEPEDYESLPCPRCHGSGHTIEGFDCDYCEGTGELDI
jgi:hypothetical protein